MPGSRSLSLSLILFLFFPSLSLAFVSSTLRLSHHTVAPRSLSTRNSFRHEQHVGRNSNFELRMGLLDDLRAKNAEMLAVREEKVLCLSPCKRCEMSSTDMEHGDSTRISLGRNMGSRTCR